MAIWQYCNLVVVDSEGEAPPASSTSGTSPIVLALDTGKMLRVSGGGVVEVPAVAGPQGPQGDPGPQGADGTDGIDGSPGADGDDGAQGPQGLQGIQGIQGIQGTQGPAGNTYLVIPFLPGTTTLTNMALADTETPATQYRLKLDLAGFTQYRATMRVATQGTANSDVRFQGSLDDSSYANLDGGAGPEVALFGVGEKDTGWVTLAASYRANNVRIRMMGKDGDGAADPVVRQIMLHFK